MDLIFFGMQGAGKGTIGEAVAERYGHKIFETGAELRRLAQEDSELGRKVKSIIDKGKLVPNKVVMEIVEDFMNKLSPDKEVLFDGIPRSVKQAKTLNSLLDKHDRDYIAVLIKIVEETALKRLTTRRICKNCKEVYPADYKKETCEKCGGELITRADDNVEAIQTRIDAYKKETLPAIELYKDKLITIDGEPSIEEVKKLAFEVLDPILKD
ncbi:adenylate kinase [Candidatus Peregrinibacteria bacterium]|nr:adenylate kinase [Candidatus Peregrinibacteria bacterium]